MNRRQAKKAYKKKYGHNPPKTEVRFYPKYHAKLVIKAMDLLPGVVERATAALRKMFEEAVRIAKETVVQVQTMPEEDFIKFLETPGMEESTKALAKQLRAAKFIKQHNGEEWETVWSREQEGKAE